MLWGLERPILKLVCYKIWLCISQAVPVTIHLVIMQCAPAIPISARWKDDVRTWRIFEKRVTIVQQVAEEDALSWDMVQAARSWTRCILKKIESTDEGNRRGYERNICRLWHLPTIKKAIKTAAIPNRCKNDRLHQKRTSWQDNTY